MTEIWIPGKPPTATAQQKGHSRSGAWYKPAKLKAAEDWYLWGLSKYRLPKPLEGAVIFSVEFRFPATKPHKDGDPKITRPDTDNMVKLLKDCMTKMGFWLDDAQVAMELVRKSYAAEPGVKIVLGRWGQR